VILGLVDLEVVFDYSTPEAAGRVLNASNKLFHDFLTRASAAAASRSKDCATFSGVAR
jgi:hypothetical protein